MLENNKTILEQANEAVVNGDNEGFLKFCTEDIKWTFIGDKIIVGKEAVRQYMLETYIEPPKFDVHKLISENDYLTAIGKINLKDSEGNVIEYSYCDVWKFRDGKMAELTAFVIETNAKTDN